MSDEGRKEEGRKADRYSHGGGGGGGCSLGRAGGQSGQRRTPVTSTTQTARAIIGHRPRERARIAHGKKRENYPLTNILMARTDRRTDGPFFFSS